MTDRLSRQDGAALLDLARAAIEDAVDGRPSASGRSRVDGLLERLEITPALEAPRGVFVTLRTKADDSPRGELRGCIGTLTPRLPLYRNVIATAPRSALKDPRFPAVAKGEVDALSIEISAITPFEPIASIDEIVVGRDGVELTLAGRHAVFLPQVAVEQGWTSMDLVRHLAVKAGLDADDWRNAALKIFQAEIFGETG